MESTDLREETPWRGGLPEILERLDGIKRDLERMNATLDARSLPKAKQVAAKVGDDA